MTIHFAIVLSPTEDASVPSPMADLDIGDQTSTRLAALFLDSIAAERLVLD